MRGAFGRPDPKRHRRPPLDELVLTILSQNTSDTNRDRAWRSLRARFPTWEDARRAGRGMVRNAIREGGLARTKSRVILDVLRRLRAERGSLDLGFLARMPVAEARAYLTGFRGVGEKTACCVLLFACGRPAFPVDTHIHRVARRLGWVAASATRAVSHAVLARAIPEARYLEAHLNMIAIGRRTCRPVRPACPACPLRPGCRYGAASRPAGTRADRRGARRRAGWRTA